MATVVNLFSRTIGKKLIMALTGLLLIIFLTGHLLGNMLLFSDDGGVAFNEYGRFMTTTPWVTVLSYATYLSIVLHIVYSVILSRYNQSARPVKYAYKGRDKSSAWTSRNMGILGTLILIFIVIHLRSFWYEYRFGEIPKMAGTDLVDLYTVVKESFSWGLYVIIYVISMIVLGFHLSHGFQSAFQTLGLNHKAYTPVIKNIGLAFSILVPALFASMPIYMYFTS